MLEPVGSLKDLVRSFPVSSDVIAEKVGDMSSDMETLMKRLKPSTLQTIDAITEIDSHVYAATVRRFLCDLRVIEVKTGKCLLREDRLGALRQTNQYIHGLL